jgi:MFS family permease
MRQFFLSLLKKQQGNDPGGKAVPSRWLALALLCIAQFMVVLDVQVVVIALPAMQREFSISQTNLPWIINAYALLFGGLLILAGRAADLFGRRRFFIAGLLLFALASLGCGLARSEAWLIATRALQGLGAACISPAALAQLTSIFPQGPERNRALGWWGAAAPVGGVTGLLLGGLLTSGAGMAQVKEAEQGLVAGLLNTAAQLGRVLGYALLDIIATSATAILKSSGYTDTSALIAGFRWAFVVSAGVAIVGVLVSAFVVDRHPNAGSPLEQHTQEREQQLTPH